MPWRDTCLRRYETVHSVSVRRGSRHDEARHIMPRRAFFVRRDFFQKISKFLFFLFFMFYIFNFKFYTFINLSNLITQQFHEFKNIMISRLKLVSFLNMNVHLF